MSSPGVKAVGLRRRNIVERLDCSYVASRVRVNLIGPSGEKPAAVRVMLSGDPTWTNAIVAVRDGVTGAPFLTPIALAAPTGAWGIRVASITELDGLTELEFRVTTAGSGERVLIEIDVDEVGE